MMDFSGINGEAEKRILVIRPDGTLFGASVPLQFNGSDRNGRSGLVFPQKGGELKVNQAEVPELLAVGDIADIDIVVTDPVGFQLREEFLATAFVQLIDAGTAVGGDQQEGGGIGKDDARDEIASRLLKMPENTNLVGEAFLSLWAVEGFADAPVKADLDGGSLRVLDGDHGGLDGKV
jgi:hypothetical protein